LSAELFFGSPVTLPGQFLDTPEPLPAVFLEEIKNSPLPPTRKQPYAEAVATPSPGVMAECFGYIRRGGCIPPLSPPYVSPYAVVSAGPKFFIVDIDGRHETVLVDRLKQHIGSSLVLSALPLPRRRPPGSGKSAAASSPSPSPDSSLGGAVWRHRPPGAEGGNPGRFR
jgi:hypothetical protein